MSFEKVVVVDCRDLMLGRLASLVAKQLLEGQKIVLVRCELINISGSLFRNHLKAKAFVRKRTNTNPKKGPFHFKAPSRIIWRTIRGMMPHKTARGKAAMERMKCFEGIPHPFDRMKRKTVPLAHRNLRLKPYRKFCVLGDLSNKLGWKHQDLINRLEDKRKVKSAAYYNTKKELNKVKAQAAASVESELADTAAALAEYGY
jgi:large subunit ribosomal protein L13Ae